MRTLVLNASGEFLGFTDYRSSICAVVTDKVVVLEEYDTIVHSPSMSMNIPAVIQLKRYVKVAYEKLTFISYTKRNIHLRDSYTCMYCGIKCPPHKATIDHVLPISRGGESTWTNTISACYICNDEKGSFTPEEIGFKLLRKPGRPRGFREIVRIRIGELHDKWIKYL